eukprot:1132447-Pyramimonas_sp.AAC.1
MTLTRTRKRTRRKQDGEGKHATHAKRSPTQCNSAVGKNHDEQLFAPFGLWGPSLGSRTAKEQLTMKNGPGELSKPLGVDVMEKDMSSGLWGWRCRARALNAKH